MAGKLKDTWFIWALLIVAAVFAVLAFSKSKPKEEAQTQDVLADKAQPAQTAAAPAVGIKPDHSPTDMKEIATKKAASAVVMPPQQVTPTASFAVQVYSFKEKARAEAALKALKDKNFKAYIMVSDLGPRGIWYRVRVGSFDNEAEVQRALEAITKDFKSGIIVTE